jgi:pilus assembly protein TadC
MGHFRLKNKFEMFFYGIGNLLFYGLLLLAALFVIGFALYQLFRGNLVWFKENGFADVTIVFILFIAFGIYFTNRKKK